MRKIYVVAALIHYSITASAQKDILINDSLVAGADMYPVKLGSQGPGKIWKLHFGDYTVISSKKNWTTGNTKTNLLDTKLESKTTDRFSFLLGNHAGDTSYVNAANNVRMKLVKEFNIIPNLSFGENEIQEEAHNFTCFITTSSDTVQNWVLYVNVTKKANADIKEEAFLTNGILRINIKPASPAKVKSAFPMPAEGFEFFEGEKPVCALQYGGPFGMNKNVIWILRSMDEGIKLILASAATAILQMKLTEMTN